jgi:hypothetical protein
MATFPELSLAVTAEAMKLFSKRALESIQSAGLRHSRRPENRPSRPFGVGMCRFIPERNFTTRDGAGSKG